MDPSDNESYATPPAGWGAVASTLLANDDAIDANVIAEPTSASGGWGDVAQLILSDVIEVPERLVNQIQSRLVRPVRGRPLGTGGSHAFRASLRLEVRQLEPQRIQQPQPLPLPLALREPVCRPPRNALLRLIPRVCTLLQRCLIAAATTCSGHDAELGDFRDGEDLAQAEEPADDVLAFVDNFLFAKERPSMTSNAESLSQGCSRTLQQNHLAVTAAGVVQTGVALWSAFLSSLAGQIESGELKGIMFIKKRLYDETPLKLRLKSDSGSSDSGGAETVKVLQTTFFIGVLVQQTSTNKYLFFQGQVPTPIQVLEKTKAVDLCHAQQLIEDLIPVLDATSSLFKCKVQFSCTDRYGANTNAEAGLQAAHPGFIKVHLPCDIHKAASSQTAQMDLAGRHISGVIAVGLVMRDGGATMRLREILFDILEEKLIICIGPPPRGYIKEHRLAIYELFLGSTLTRSEDKPSQLRLRARQRAVLNHFLVGDLEDGDSVPFWTLTETSKEDVLQQFKQHVIPALLPHAIPIFPRSRWLGGECAIDSIGLLSAHHNLFKPSILRFVGQSSSSDAMAEAGPNDARGAAPIGWGSVAARFDESNVEHPFLAAADDDNVSNEVIAHDVESEFQPAQLPDPASIPDPETKWAEYNQSLKNSVMSWVLTDPLCVLVMLRTAMSPVTDLLCKFLHISGKKWSTQQQQKQAAGGQASYRILEACIGEDLPKAFAQLSGLFHEVPAALPAIGMLRYFKAFLFRLLSRVTGALHQLLRRPRRGFPYKLWAALRCDGLEVSEADECLKDELATWFTDTYSMSESLADDEPQSMLHSLGSVSEVDIASIESRHAAIRRILTSKSIQTWVASLETLSAENVVRSSSIRRHEFQSARLGFSGAHRQQQKVRQSNSDRKNPKRRKATVKSKGGGGGQRAFFHVKCQGLDKDVWKSRKALFRRLNAEYRGLTAEELAYYAELGQAAACSHSIGSRSFGLTVLSHYRRRGNSSAVMPHCADTVIQQIVKKAKLTADSERKADTAQEAQHAKVLAAFCSGESAPKPVGIKFAEDDAGLSLSSSFLPCALPVPTLQWCVPADHLVKVWDCATAVASMLFV
jgi:hypothetical protein